MLLPAVVCRRHGIGAGIIRANRVCAKYRREVACVGLWLQQGVGKVGAKPAAKHQRQKEIVVKPLAGYEAACRCFASGAVYGYNSVPFGCGCVWVMRRAERV